MAKQALKLVKALLVGATFSISAVAFGEPNYPVDPVQDPIPGYERQFPIPSLPPTSSSPNTTNNCAEQRALRTAYDACMLAKIDLTAKNSALIKKNGELQHSLDALCAHNKVIELCRDKGLVK
jgi:hypothetical protein